MGPAIQQQIEAIFAASRALEQMFPGRHFTPDGHMVGSLGEVIAAERYGLTLQPASTKGHDALAVDGRRVEIKATFGTKGSTRIGLGGNHAQHLLVLRLSPESGASVETIYNGPCGPVWEAAGPPRKGGKQSFISVAKLRRLQPQVRPDQQLLVEAV